MRRKGGGREGAGDGFEARLGMENFRDLERKTIDETEYSLSIYDLI